MAVAVDKVFEQLESRRRELKDRLARSSADLLHRNEPLVADYADQGVQRENDDVVQSIAQSVRTELSQLNLALERLARGRYGVCETCGEPIEPKRLQAVPYTTHCVRCAELV